MWSFLWINCWNNAKKVPVLVSLYKFHGILYLYIPYMYVYTVYIHICMLYFIVRGWYRSIFYQVPLYRASSQWRLAPSSHFDIAPSRRSRDHTKSGEARAGEGLWFIPFFSPNDPTGLITRYACRRRLSFINIVDLRHSPDERWTSVLSLPFIIDSFCRSDLVSLRLAPLCQSAGWCAR